MSHSFNNDYLNIGEKEKTLQQVLNDFHSGRMQAFGGSCTFEKLEKVRNMQEALAVKHLKIDASKTGTLHDDAQSLEKFEEIMDDLCTLSGEIKKLHES